MTWSWSIGFAALSFGQKFVGNQIYHGSAIIEVAGAVGNELINLLRCPGNNFTARLR